MRFTLSRCSFVGNSSKKLMIMGKRGYPYFFTAAKNKINKMKNYLAKFKMDRTATITPDGRTKAKILDNIASKYGPITCTPPKMFSLKLVTITKAVIRTT